MLKTDYTNDILDTSKNTERVYNLKNASGQIVEENIRIEDVTEYSQEGSKFGANDINATNTEVNGLSANVGSLNGSVSTLNTNVSTLTTKTNTLQANVNNINVYVGTDKKLHFVNKDGADSALPFSSGGLSGNTGSCTVIDGTANQVGKNLSFTFPAGISPKMIMGILYASGSPGVVSTIILDVANNKTSIIIKKLDTSQTSYVTPSDVSFSISGNTVYMSVTSSILYNNLYGAIYYA